MAWRFGIGVALLVLQAGAIVRARFADDRYFCWAPFDQQTDYTIAATVAGRPLAAAEIRARYRRPARGIDNRATFHLVDLLTRAELAHAPAERAEVELRYRVNGGEERVWRWQP